MGYYTTGDEDRALANGNPNLGGIGWGPDSGLLVWVKEGKVVLDSGVESWGLTDAPDADLWWDEYADRDDDEWSSHLVLFPEHPRAEGEPVADRVAVIAEQEGLDEATTTLLVADIENYRTAE